MKYLFFGSTVKPACAYCRFSSRGADKKMLLCSIKGVVDDQYHCRKYRYDPLRRQPRIKPQLQRFKRDDFKL